MGYYLLFALIALSSLVVKGLFLCFVPSHKLPSFLENTLRYIPPPRFLHWWPLPLSTGRELKA